MRRSCRICGHVTNMKNMKRLHPTLRNPKIILAASLSLIGKLEKANINAMVKNMSKNMTFICHSHVIQAAQYLCAELIASGRCITYCHDPCEGKTIAYVSTADIPSHLVEKINAVSNSGDTVTAREVWSFINEALKRYYGTVSWPNHDDEKEQLEKAVTASEKDVGMIKPEPVDDFASTRNDQESTYEPCSSDSKSNCGAVEDLGETEAADTQRYFLVKGERLLKLFRFCPECGRKLTKTQLKAFGTAAVVRFACGNCVNSWESRDDVVPY